MQTRERFQAWVTRYALTEGIWQGEAVVSENEVKTIIFYRADGTGQLYIHGADWHRTEEAATKRAEEMRTRKIGSLRKQIAKLEALTFAPDNAG